jgi:hypothetical protein
MLMLQAFTVVGAFVGLLTGIFTLWDRLSRGRPLAWLDFALRDTHSPDFFELSPKLNIANLNEFSVFIISVDIRPNVYFLPADFEIKTLIKSQLEHPGYICIPPKGAISLLISSRIKAGMPLDHENKQVRFKIHWRRGDAPGMPRLPIFLSTKTAFISKMAKRGPVSSAISP